MVLLRAGEMRDLGGMGESFFHFWCSREGLAANKSLVDRTGWDYLVEFPFLSSPTTLDVHRSAPECKIQVKATDAKIRKLSIKLSNLRRLATSKTPSFIVFLEFNKKSEPDNVFIVHLGKKLTFNILKRIREIESKGDGDKLNKKTMTIHYDDTNRVLFKEESSFTNTFQMYIENDYDKYVREKLKYLENVGFDNKPYSFSFTAIGKDKAHKLNDLFLGLVESVEVENAIGRCTRFGITEELYPLQSNKAIIKVPNLQPTYEGRIRVKCKRPLKRISIPAKIYSGQAFYFDGYVGNKMRIKTTCFEMIHEYQENDNVSAKFKFILEPSERVLFSDFLDNIGAYEIISTASAKQCVQLEICANGMNPIHLDINDTNLSPNKKLLKSVEIVKGIVNFFGIGNHLLVSKNDILSSTYQAAQILSLVNCPAKKVTAELAFEEGTLPIDDPVACILYITIDIGDHRCGFFFSILGNVTETSPLEYIVNAQKTITSDKIVEMIDNYPDDGEIYEMFNEVESQYSNKYITFKIKDGMLLD